MANCQKCENGLIKIEEQYRYCECEKGLFRKNYDECHAMEVNEFNWKEFIEYCENMYKMTTEEFHKYYKEHNFEGNVDMQLWYHITKQN